MTTWTYFCQFLAHTYLYLDIFSPECRQIGIFHGPPTTSSCPHSHWMSPCCWKSFRTAGKFKLLTCLLVNYFGTTTEILFFFQKKKYINNFWDFSAFNNKATVSEQKTESKKCCEKRHCHCDEKQSKEKKKMSLKDLRSPSMEYALELGKQILKSPLSSPKVACIWVRI